MNAGMLREAATRLRELAEAATEGPWVPDGPEVGADGIWFAATVCGALSDDQDEANAAYIATVHPRVALAVADWLSTVADGEEYAAKVGGVVTDDYPDHPAALTVAAAVLGRDGGQDSLRRDT